MCHINNYWSYVAAAPAAQNKPVLVVLPRERSAPFTCPPCSTRPPILSSRSARLRKCLNLTFKYKINIFVENIVEIQGMYKIDRRGGGESKKHWTHYMFKFDQKIV